MAGQRPPKTLHELSKQVSETVIYNIAYFVDEDKIARAVFRTVSDSLDPDEDHIKIAAGAVEDAVRETVNEQEIMDAVTEGLSAAGFTNDPQTAEASNTGENSGSKPKLAAWLPFLL